MDFSSLKQTIDANIIGNGTQNITGDVLNVVLTDMIEVDTTRIPIAFNPSVEDWDDIEENL
jgi:hypothetical protein